MPTLPPSDTLLVPMRRRLLAGGALLGIGVLSGCGMAPRRTEPAPVVVADVTPARLDKVPPVQAAPPPAVNAPPATAEARAAASLSRAARRVADWSTASDDHQGGPFLIVDKPNARLHVFDTRGRLLGTSPVLLGLTRGDYTVPGIGDKPLDQIHDNERTTPAGRFVAERGRNLHGDDILWIDYDSAVSMHRVRSVNAGENRLQRLRTPTPRDNRISYGCINVPVRFFDRVLEPAIGKRRTLVVYVLPDVKPLETVFDFGRSRRAG